ncbi:DUF4240 domain-containing protein [Bacillus sp. NEAU-Y102]
MGIEMSKGYKTLWEVIKETKDGKEYLNSQKQYENLEKVLASLDIENVKIINTEWRKITDAWYDDVEFNKLHISEGGFVNAGDDGFYMDFRNWLLVQGEELYNEMKERGHMAVVDYVNKHQIGESEYRFECMIYALHPYLD